MVIIDELVHNIDKKIDTILKIKNNGNSRTKWNKTFTSCA